jgi:hypothetical protein
VRLAVTEVRVIGNIWSWVGIGVPVAWVAEVEDEDSIDIRQTYIQVFWGYKIERNKRANIWFPYLDLLAVAWFHFAWCLIWFGFLLVLVVAWFVVSFCVLWFIKLNSMTG